MKRKTSISFIALAYLLLSAIYVVPHHHHEGMFCVIMKHCEEDGNNTHHHDDHQVPEHSCIAKTYYIIPRAHNHVKCNAAFCSSLHSHIFFSLLYLVPDSLELNLEYYKIKPDYGEPILYYNPATASQSHGLRAPPFVG